MSTATLQRYTNAHTSIDDLLAVFDREAFGVFCRTLEVLILRGQDVRCHNLLVDFLAHHSVTQPTMASRVDEVLPVRIANALESAGYTTIAAASDASDANLQSIPNFGPESINLVRRIAKAIKAGTFDRGMIPQSPGGNDPDLAPDWDPPTVHDLYPVFLPSPTEHYTVNNFSQPGAQPSQPKDKVDLLVDMLLHNGTAAIAEIDKAIGELEEKLEGLRRVRKMLGGVAKPKRVSAATGKPYGRNVSSDTADLDTLYSEINAAKPKLMTVKQLADATGIHHMRIRGLIRNSDGCLVESDKGVALGV